MAQMESNEPGAHTMMLCVCVFVYTHLLRGAGAFYRKCDGYKVNMGQLIPP